MRQSPFSCQQREKKDDNEQRNQEQLSRANKLAQVVQSFLIISSVASLKNPHRHILIIIRLKP